MNPNYEYSHGTGPSEGDTIIGGYVYRGAITELRGRYFFADFINERIWSLRIDRATGAVTEFLDWTDAFVPDVGAIQHVVSFGEDAWGNLYVVDFDGEIFRVVGPTAAVPALAPHSLALLALALAATGAVAIATRGSYANSRA